jgi:hypothetical protein
MAGSLTRRLALPLAVALAAVVCVVPADSCPFCSMQGKTLTGDVNEASMVLYGTLSNAQVAANGEFGQGTTDLTIEAVIKKHELLGDKKVITLPRFIPAGKGQDKFLIFCDVFKGKIDPYRGVPVPADSDIVRYLKGALEVKDKPISERLKFFFDFLDNKDTEIANDSYKEFGNSDYKDYRDMARDLPADKVAAWLEDPNTPAFRHGLYASMLGHCGKEKHADLLRKLLDDPQKRASSGVDGMFAGYTLLRPKEGWAYVRSILNDPKQEFMLRYAALRGVRFFWENRTDVIDKKAVAEAVALLLDQGDIADLAIEDLRKWQQWDVADRVIDLAGKKTHDVPIIRRSILRYALSCPANEKAKAFVEEMRKKDAEGVKDAEELLKLETGGKQ